MNEARYDEAAKQLNEAFSQDSKNLEVQYMIGLLERLRKNYDKAEKIYNDLVAAKPDAVDAKNQLELVLIMAKDDARKRRALEVAEANFKANQRNAEILSTYAWVLYKMNRIDDAERIFNQLNGGV